MKHYIHQQDRKWRGSQPHLPNRKKHLWETFSWITTPITSIEKLIQNQKVEGLGPFGKLAKKDNIKVDFIEIVINTVERIHLAQYEVRWRDHVNKMIKFWLHKRRGVLWVAERLMISLRNSVTGKKFEPGSSLIRRTKSQPNYSTVRFGKQCRHLTNFRFIAYEIINLC